MSVIDSPPPVRGARRPWPDDASPTDAPPRATPVIVCMNASWGEDGLLETGLRWAAHAGRALVAVYVLTGARPGRREVRAADRAMVHARGCADREGHAARLITVRGADVADGLAVTAAMTGGEVLLWPGRSRLRALLGAARVPFREVTWRPA